MIEVVVTHAEAAAVGVNPETVFYGEKLKPVLVAKGVDERLLYIGSRHVVPIRYEVDHVVFGVRE